MIGLPLPRDLLLLLHVTLPCWMAAGALFLAGEHSRGWSGLSLAIYGVLRLAIWAVLVIALCIWILLRDGFAPSSGLPALVLIGTIAGGAVWGGSKWLEQRRCTQGADFFAAYAAAAPTERRDMIAAQPAILAQPTWCGIEALQYWFGLDHEGRPVLSEDQDRLGGLHLLLQAGLMPTDQMIYDAARYGDVEMVRLYAQFRAAAGLEPWPPRAASAAFEAYDNTDPGSPLRVQHLAALRLFVEGGVDMTHKTGGMPSLADRMERAGLPWRNWLIGPENNTRD